ncbi:enoyl-CoA hydratase-related protein [Amycolatopsis saalfeldensis]|uniref:enoyl-CoA hydratase-related protein n=1 Tax=Amycolatopsis saalfeldensis TaxID=394193 RepID=UPI000B8362FD|nr:enoyl-CoA hydratase-related protein [Amycolatopsis saalfeldensis]
MDADYETIAVRIAGRVATITLRRPEALNALNLRMMRELVEAAHRLDDDRAISVLILEGSARAFAAGADIKEMADRSYSEMYLADWFTAWDRLTAIRKPMIAAVAGYALGGGCELAMLCDVIVAAQSARFGQPEVKLGIPPGIGGSQRLTRAVGKAKAMELCLTGRMMDAHEAERGGLVARVVPDDELGREVGELAEAMAAASLAALLTIKECVNRAFETPLAEGVRFERRAFHAAFATADQKEGMAAFAGKRPPVFTHG